MAQTIFTSILIFSIIGLIVLIVLISIIFFIIKYKNNPKKNLEKICLEIKSALDNKIITLKCFCNGPYNIYLETQYNICYIKVYKVTNSKILKIDSNNDFHLLNSPIESNQYKLNIEEFLNVKTEDTKKRVRKVIIFYPSVQEKIYYKTKYNIEFIKKEEENKGCNILSGYEIHNYFKDFEIPDYSNDSEI